MEKLIAMVRMANKSLMTADHMLYVTMPVVNDNKLMIAVVENLFRAVSGGMESIVYYDRLYKRIGPYADSFEGKFEAFKEKCARRYNFSPEEIALVSNLKRIVEARNKSPIEFSRRDSFVICSPTYRMETITIEKLKNFLKLGKEFVERVNRIVKQNV